VGLEKTQVVSAGLKAVLQVEPLARQPCVEKASAFAISLNFSLWKQTVAVAWRTRKIEPLLSFGSILPMSGAQAMRTVM